MIGGAGIAGDRHADPHSPRQVLLAGTAVYRELGLAPLALRENLLLDIDTSALASGTLLRVGADALLRVMFQCEACGGLDRHQPGLSGRIGARRGALARVVGGSDIRVGDQVSILGQRLPAWPEEWPGRVRRVLDALPPGQVIEYRDLARLAGLMSSYCRAFPAAIRRLGPDYAGKAVAAGSESGLPRWTGAGLFEDEGAASG
ncbi:hypothetical protein B0920_05120 [Massilia sp. KIM]|nr:hypothetical protein B0920_05120 [Massilia sp. KIM]